MNKISRFLIYCIALILSICSFVVPTYCYESNYTIDLVDSFPNNSNFYNLSNISYITLKNFYINRLIDDLVFYTTSVEYFNDYIDGQVIVDDYELSFPSTDNKLNIFSTYIVKKTGTYFSLFLDDWSISGLDNFELPFNSEYGLSFTFHFIPPNILNGNYNYKNCHIYGYWNFNFDIEFNNQYFYNDTFCLNDLSILTSGIQSDILGDKFNNPQYFYKDVTLIDNLNNSYNAKFTSPTKVFSNSIVKFSTSSIDDIYIKGYKSRLNFGTSPLGDTNFRGGRFYLDYRLKYLTSDNTYQMPFYSGNSLGQDSLSSPLIPNGSNTFYKTGEWWDISTHLYNLFIYLIFDAPIISNFTELVLILINFIVEVFDFIIGLFTGINNIFFISIFVGIIVLIFLLKIIFKG